MNYIVDFLIRKENNTMKYIDMIIAAVTGFCFGWLLKYIKDEKKEYLIDINQLIDKPREI